MTKDEALKLALEALELHGKQYPHMVKGYCLDALTAIKEALAQPEQESVGYVSEGSAERLATNKQAHEQIRSFRLFTHDVPLYTAPQRTGVGLTDQEIELIYAVTIKIRKKDIMPGEQKMFAETIQYILKKKNTCITGAD